MERTKVEPDVSYIRKILTSGGACLKKCFQCATCSVVCTLSPDERPFPRKEMIWAQWGLKDRLFADPHIWLCHECNDCSVHCPRGVKPSEVLAAQRNLAIQHYSTPGFLARMAASPSYIPVLLLIPTVIVGITVALFKHAGLLHPAEGPLVEYARMFPHLPLNILFSTLFGLACASVLFGAYRFWKEMNRLTSEGNPGKPVAFSAGDAVQALKEIVLHSRFRKCETEQSRSTTHLLVVGSFVGLLIVTLAAIAYILLGLPYPMPLTDPFKVLGNVSAALLFGAVTYMIIKRLFLREPQLGRGSYFDWSFLLVLFGVAVTGIACEVLRLAELPAAAYPMYFVHLILVFCLLIYTPFTKFAHVVYRTVAMTYCLGAERNMAAEAQERKIPA
jgi:quinone-modifying oxidoreductase subunit QmoC